VDRTAQHNTANLAPSELEINNEARQRIFFALQSHILSTLGPSLCALYRQPVRNLIRNRRDSPTSKRSARTLIRLIKKRSAVAYRHSGIVRTMGSRAKIPTVKIQSRQVRGFIAQEYWECCKHFHGVRVVGLHKWDLLVRIGEMMAKTLHTNTNSASKGSKIVNPPFLQFFEGPKVLGAKMKRMNMEKIRTGHAENDIELNWATALRNFLEMTNTGSHPVRQDENERLVAEFEGEFKVQRAGKGAVQSSS
jgi:hypothetical protein